MPSRRESLKIIGAIGTTCAFPFSADELYGQHVHTSATPPAQEVYKPRAFSAADFAIISQIAERIIPVTDTPGATGAGVPQYIDTVVSANPEHKKRFQAGLHWINRESKRRFRKKFMRLSESQQIEILIPLSEGVDSGREKEAGEKFFGLMKRLTADGYYTSQVGLVQELGYAGNTALEKFPSCEIHEH